MLKNQILKRENIFFAGSILLIFLYFLPYFLLGENSPLSITDKLDIHLVTIKILLDNNLVFSHPSTVVNQIFNGISRTSLFPSIDLSFFGFNYLGMYWGYVFNRILMALTAWGGMYLFLKHHFLPKETFNIIPYGVALLFSLLPFHFFNVTVAGLPIIFYAFLNLRKNKNYFFSWLILTIFPFWSSLILSGFFIILWAIFLLIYDTFRGKNFNYLFFSGIVFMGFMYMISHYYMFYQYFFEPGYLSNRIEFKFHGISSVNVIIKILKLIVFGHFHSSSFHSFLLIPIALGFFIRFYSRCGIRYYGLLFLFIGVSSLMYGMEEWEPLVFLKNGLMKVVPIQFDRFYLFHTLFWYLLFAMALHDISTQTMIAKSGFILFILIFQMLYLFKNHEIFMNRAGASFHTFYAEKQFQEINKFLEMPQSAYRVVCIGIHPSIAQYNGFYTLDGFMGDYPLNYKHRFRKIIAKELDKNGNLKEYYDNWGARCYAFSAELGQNFASSDFRRIEKLDYDFLELKKMGCHFIISQAEINTHSNKEIMLLKSFEKGNDSFWKIYLYKVI